MLSAASPTPICRARILLLWVLFAVGAALYGSLTVDVREVPDEPDAAAAGQSFLVTVHGADRVGIVARLAAVVAEADGNITDLTTRLAGELYVLVAEVDLPAAADVTQLETRLAAVAAELGVEAHLRPVERDEL